ncbi:hypothetical protein [Parvibaculum sp.]|uniref:hypothetical protein n=1 Tax=Parvibaculum sp. TaxID=2024848 RepID=UPI00272F9C37|nr:hypothetical protein [Parvibaculum sp.]MDP1627051.1 hypothetical protein [Parvibaculum sp.]MDP2149358.1 hypothetical protein [Parvibaculum sp.]MDP3326827.1 hypothetical protein [Parvibaculum sp.]
MLSSRLLAGIGAAAIVGVVLLEALARWGLGLGTPPLSITDATIEYMFAPNQDVYRFGNHQIFNEFGMRSEGVPDKKPENEFRILAIGDSILNGGSLTDHEELATTLLSNNGVRVLNASAGSWGPQNMEAYIDKFGLFDSDLLVVVLSSHDAADVPTYKPLNQNTHPTKAPVLALAELATRYLPRYLPIFDADTSDEDPLENDKSDSRALEAVTALAKQPIPTCFILHPTRNEYQTGVRGAGYAAIRRAADGAKIIDESQFIRSDAYYRDGIHLSADGQKALAEAIAACRN